MHANRPFQRAASAALLALAVSTSAPTVLRAQAADSAAAVAVVAKFHASLAAGDSTAALSLLADDVRILETGGVEDKQHYRSGHLAGDLNYAKAVPSQRTTVSVMIRGAAAWVVSTSTTVGDYNGRAINSQGAELMVLSKGADGWKISAVHWSSRARRPAP